MTVTARSITNLTSLCSAVTITTHRALGSTSARREEQGAGTSQALSHSRTRASGARIITRQAHSIRGVGAVAASFETLTILQHERAVARSTVRTESTTALQASLITVLAAVITQHSRQELAGRASINTGLLSINKDAIHRASSTISVRWSITSGTNTGTGQTRIGILISIRAITAFHHALVILQERSIRTGSASGGVSVAGQAGSVTIFANLCVWVGHCGAVTVEHTLASGGLIESSTSTGQTFRGRGTIAGLALHATQSADVVTVSVRAIGTDSHAGGAEQEPRRARAALIRSVITSGTRRVTGLAGAGGIVFVEAIRASSQTGVTSFIEETSLIATGAVVRTQNALGASGRARTALSGSIIFIGSRRAHSQARSARQKASGTGSTHSARSSTAAVTTGSLTRSTSIRGGIEEVAGATHARASVSVFVKTFACEAAGAVGREDITGSTGRVTKQT